MSLLQDITIYQYRIYSKKSRGAYLIFHVSGVALIRWRRLLTFPPHVWLLH